MKSACMTVVLALMAGACGVEHGEFTLNAYQRSVLRKVGEIVSKGVDGDGAVLDVESVLSNEERAALIEISDSTARAGDSFSRPSATGGGNERVSWLRMAVIHVSILTMAYVRAKRNLPNLTAPAARTAAFESFCAALVDGRLADARSTWDKIEINWPIR